MNRDQAGDGRASRAAGARHSRSHGEGTTKPDDRPEAPPARGRAGSDSDIREEVPAEDIYGGRADVAGYEDEVDGASEDAAG